MAGVADYYVVEQLNSHQLTRRFQGSRHALVFITWRGNSGRMIVRRYKRGRANHNRPLENLAWMNRTTSRSPRRDDRVGANLMSSV